MPGGRVGVSLGVRVGTGAERVYFWFKVLVCVAPVETSLVNTRVASIAG